MTPNPRRLLKHLSPAALAACHILKDAGFDAYVVGGAVRDLVRNIVPVDYDIATSATPGQVSTLFRRVIPTGVEHGTVTVLLRRSSLEVTTFRTESGYSNGRHPDAVSFDSSIDEDLSRRDFTINGMALDPVAELLLDPFAGQRDLDAGIIRAIGDPHTRFREDALRLLRAVRFSTQLEFDIEPATWAALCDCAAGISRISPERVREELTRILTSRLPSRGLRLMHESGLLAQVIPELDAGAGVEQRGEHRFDVLEHSLLTCDAAPSDNLEVRLAALLHDVGKPETLAVVDGERTFHGHDQLSGEMSAEILRRLRYPNATIHSVTHLVRHHMFNYTPEWSDAAVRRFLARVGTDRLDDLFALREADSFAQQGERRDTAALDAFRLRIADVLAKEHALDRKSLAVNGNDLARVGIPKGPEMGIVIDHLFETILDDPSQNTRERLITIATRFYDSRVRDTDVGDTAGEKSGS